MVSSRSQCLRTSSYMNMWIFADTFRKSPFHPQILKNATKGLSCFSIRPPADITPTTFFQMWKKASFFSLLLLPPHYWAQFCGISIVCVCVSLCQAAMCACTYLLLFYLHGNAQGCKQQTYFLYLALHTWHTWVISLSGQLTIGQVDYA